MTEKPNEIGIVHLWDLPEKEIYLDFENSYKGGLLNTARILAGGKWNDLPRKIGIPLLHHGDSAIRSFRRGKLASLFLIKKVSKFLVDKKEIKFSLDEIEKNVLCIACKNSKQKIFYPRFPINFNTREGAIIISAMFHDGGITTRDFAPFYSNINKGMIKRVSDAIEKLIGNVPFNIRKGKEIDFPKPLGLIFVSLGLVPGKRQINNPEFPQFIFNYSNDLICEFLSQAIADDGYIYCPKKNFGYIAFNFTIDLTKLSIGLRQNVKNNKLVDYLPNVLLCDKNLFERLGVSVGGPYFGNERYYCYGDGKEKRYTQEWRMNIRDYRSLNFLRKHFNIPLKYKQDKLGEISRKKREQSGIRYEILVLLKKLGKASRFEIADNAGLSVRTTDYSLIIFEKRKLVNSERCEKRRDSIIYSLTDDGIMEAELFE